MTTPMFDKISDRYDAYNQIRDRLAPATATWLSDHLPGGSRACDLGCGPGRFTGLAADRYDQVLAVDLSETMIDRARHLRSRPNIRYQRRSLLDVVPQRDGTFDAVITVNTIHHAGPLEEVLPHVRQLVAPGGWLLLVDIVDPGGWGDRQWHIDQAFAAAGHFYRAGGEDTDAAADVLRLLAHPVWLDMTTADVPPTRNEYHRQAATVFPNAQFFDDLHPLGLQAALVWQAPEASPG